MTKQEKLWNPSFLMLMGLGVLIAVSFYMVAPILTSHLVELGATVDLAGVIVGMFSIVALIMRPLGGLLTDRVNKKMLFIISVALLGISLLGYAVSKRIGPVSFIRILHGAAFSVNATVNLALVADKLPHARLSEGIGYFGLGQIIATAIGPDIGIRLGEAFGYSVTFAVAGGILVLTSLLLFLLPDEGKAKAADCAKKKLVLGDLISVKVIPLSVFGGLFSMLNGVISAYLVLMGEARGLMNVSLYFTVNAICLVFSRSIAGKVADKKGLAWVAYPALALAAAAAFLLGQAHTMAAVLIAAVFKAFGQGSAQPSIQAACIRMLPPEKRGVATSTYYVGADLGQGFGPMAAGAIVAAMGYEAMFTACALLFVLAIPCYWLAQRFKLV